MANAHFAKRTNWNLQTNRLSEALDQHRAAAKPLLDLTASNPTKCGFQYDSETILHALANNASLAYEPQSQGLLSAREVVAEYYAKRGDRVSPANIILTTSTSEAYSFAFRLLCDPGDEILVPAPGYPLFDFLADVLDVKIARYPLFYDCGWQIDFDRLERAITPSARAIIVVHPNNPTGNFCAAAEAEKLAELCSRHGLALIADEVFLDFALIRELASGADVGAGSPPKSFVAADNVLTFTMSGISKICGLPQMKLAWLVANGPAEAKSHALSRLEIIADTYLSMNAPIQHAACSFLAGRNDFQRQLMSRVRANLAELDRQLARQQSCSRLEIRGGWYAVIRVPRTRSDEDLAIDLLEKHGVSLHPGHFYEFPADGYLVVSLITPAQAFSEGIALLLRTAI
ncbi:MAG: pyridoxal phosphate-dependent aminotransferase [Candidatus Acidiferrales bacterium]